jgi:hypothetical protein
MATKSTIRTDRLTRIIQATRIGTRAVILTRVSGPSPFADCTIGGPGTNFINAEVEPSVAANPTRVRNRRSVNLIGVWQQDRWSSGNSHGIVAGSSFDGGQTWRRTPLPFSACAPNGLNFPRASDPWISFGPDGIAYVTALSVNRSNRNSAVSAITSTDGGRTWRNLKIIKADRGPLFSNDKPSVTADPIRPGVAYVVWRLVERTSSSRFITAPTWFATTTNGGRTWSQPRIIFAPGRNNSTVGHQIVVDPRNGTLFNFFRWIIRTGGNRGTYVAVQISKNGGRTWSAPTIIARNQLVAMIHPNTGVRIRTGNDPYPAIDSRRGTLYVVWKDGRFNGGQFNEIVISRSTNGGADWSKPIRVSPPTGKSAFTPTVAVNSEGIVGVSYYDFRNLTTETSTLPTNYWFTTSTDGGRSFEREFQIAGPFDMLTAPRTRGGRFLGDYQGLTTVNRSFQLFFVKANSGNTANRTDVFTTTVNP